jgi:hypothetical protein
VRRFTNSAFVAPRREARSRHDSSHRSGARHRAVPRRLLGAAQYLYPSISGSEFRIGFPSRIPVSSIPYSELRIPHFVDTMHRIMEIGQIGRTLSAWLSRRLLSRSC